ncbi:hypothetical protein J2W97_001216 [Paenibacillus jamilae]|nr:hypothetical protein [Paenibacillus jamilae]
MEKMMKLAKEQGIKVTENSDQPGFFVTKDGVKKRVGTKELLSICFDLESQ